VPTVRQRATGAAKFKSENVTHKMSTMGGARIAKAIPADAVNLNTD
jgi:hypothetical protein